MHKVGFHLLASTAGYFDAFEHRCRSPNLPPAEKSPFHGATSMFLISKRCLPLLFDAFVLNGFQTLCVCLRECVVAAFLEHPELLETYSPFAEHRMVWLPRDIIEYSERMAVLEQVVGCVPRKYRSGVVPGPLYDVYQRQKAWQAAGPWRRSAIATLCRLSNEFAVGSGPSSLGPPQCPIGVWD